MVKTACIALSHSMLLREDKTARYNVYTNPYPIDRHSATEQNIIISTLTVDVAGYLPFAPQMTYSQRTHDHWKRDVNYEIGP